MNKSWEGRNKNKKVNFKEQRELKNNENEKMEIIEV